jgi:hypothetical protein
MAGLVLAIHDFPRIGTGWMPGPEAGHDGGAAVLRHGRC